MVNAVGGSGETDGPSNIILDYKVFRDMILFSGRFANYSIPEEEWKEVYGFLVGKLSSDGSILSIVKLIPMVHGTRTEVYFGEKEYALGEKIMDELMRRKLFICGWFHTHPGLGLFLSDIDRVNQLGFQNAYRWAVAAVFDFTMLGEKNGVYSSGLKMFRLKEPLSAFSEYYEVGFTLRYPEDPRKFFAGTLVDIAGKTYGRSPLIMEAGEILNEYGDLSPLFADLDYKSEESAGTSINGDIRPSDNMGAEYIDSPLNISEMDNNISSVFSEEQTFYGSNSSGRIDSNSDYGNLYTDSSGGLSPAPESNEDLEEYFGRIIENDPVIIRLMEELRDAEERGVAPGAIHMMLASRYRVLGDYRSELKELETAESYFAADNDIFGLTAVYNELGIYYAERGYLDDSLNYFEEAERYAEKTGNERYVLRIVLNRVSVFLDFGMYDRALELLEKYYSRILGSGDGLLIFMAALFRAEILIYLNRYNDAFRLLVGLKRRAEVLENKFALAFVFGKLGKLLIRMGPKNYNIAGSLLRSAINLKKEIGYEESSIEDYLELYKIPAEEGNFAAALSYLFTALEIVRRFELGFEEWKVYKAISEVYSLMGDIDGSLRYGEYAADSCEKSGRLLKAADIYMGLGKLASSYGINERALFYFSKASELYNGLGYTARIAEVLVKKADIEINLGDYTAALEDMYEARRLYSELLNNDAVTFLDARISSLEDYMRNRGDLSPE